MLLPFMVQQGAQQYVTENYVSVPPALTITDEAGSIWTLGFRSGEAPCGEFAFNVLKDGRETGETASRIERRNGRIRIFTVTGWKWMTTTVPAPFTVHAFGARLDRVRPPEKITTTIFSDTGLQALFQFQFDSALGGVVKLQKAIICPTGVWLCAIVDPICAAKVMASLDGGMLREVPVIYPFNCKE